NVAEAHLLQGRIGDAEQAIGQAIGHAPDSPLALLIPYHIAFLKHDVTGMDRLAEQAKGKPLAGELLTHLQGLVLARRGRLQAAGQRARDVIELATAAGKTNEWRCGKPALRYGKRCTETRPRRGGARRTCSTSQKDGMSRTARRWRWRLPATAR